MFANLPLALLYLRQRCPPTHPFYLHFHPPTPKHHTHRRLGRLKTSTESSGLAFNCHHPAIPPISSLTPFVRSRTRRNPGSNCDAPLILELGEIRVCGYIYTPRLRFSNLLSSCFRPRSRFPPTMMNGSQLKSLEPFQEFARHNRYHHPA